MLTKIQIRAQGATALDVERDLRDAIAKTESTLGLQGSISEQVIEGTPGIGFEGRISYRVGSVREPRREKPRSRAAVQRLDAVARQDETTAVGKVSVPGGEVA